MGERGPAPKRSDQRRRTNTPAAGEPTEAVAASKVTIPRADKDWHPTAKRWYASLAKSGQSVFYEPSDWMAAYVLAESISRELSPQPLVVGAGREARVDMVELPPKAGTLTAWLKGMTQLLATEADRRRAAVELQRPDASGEETDGNVEWIDDAKRRLRGAG